MENLSLFNWESAEQEQMPQNNSGNLDVVKMEFLEAETLSWKELFSGFDTLHAITYSSGIGFVYQLLEGFPPRHVWTLYIWSFCSRSLSRCFD